MIDMGDRTNPLDLSGRVALISGGAGHIGRSCASMIAAQGAQVAVIDLHADRVEETVASLCERFGAIAEGWAADLADPSSPSKIALQVADRFGRLDIIVNTAALVGTSELTGWAVPFAEQGRKAWDLALAVNLSGPFFLTQACHPLLAASGNASVVNVSSIYGSVGPDLSLYAGTAMQNPAAYGASKGGLEQLTRWLATVLAPQVRVNAVAPGGIERGQPDVFKGRYCQRTPLGRMGTEEDVASAVLFLVSSMASYITGETIRVDGGFTTW